MEGTNAMRVPYRHEEIRLGRMELHSLDSSFYLLEWCLGVTLAHLMNPHRPGFTYPKQVSAKILDLIGKHEIHTDRGEVVSSSVECDLLY